jgi:5-methylcytosine-specific restriction endonuclease McrA
MHYFTGKPCVNGHVEKRFVQSGACMGCNRNQAAKRFKADPEKYKADVAKSRAKHADKIRERRQAKYLTDPEYFLKNGRKWRTDKKEQYEAGRLKRFLSDPERHLKVRRDWYQRNAEERRKYALEYQKNNPDTIRANQHKRRARKLAAEGMFTAEDVKSLFAAQGGKCSYCFVKLGKKYHVDHIMPLARGGSNWPENLQICCGPCNISKGAKDPHDFARYIGRLI